MERVAIFIDGSNLYHGLKEVCGRPDLDFEKFIAWLVRNRKLIRTYYYNAPRSDSSRAAKDQQRFFDKLRMIPYFDVRLGRLEPRGGTFVEKGIDIAIAVDMVTMGYRDAFDTAILVSSDGDFAQAVDAIRETGRHVEVACFPRAYHLKRVADKVIDLDANSLAGLFMGDPLQ